MKNEEWVSTFLTCLGLLHGVLAPATYFIKNSDKSDNYKKSNYVAQQSVPKADKKVYPAHAEYAHPARDLTSEIIREISEIKIPQRELPAQIPVYDNSEEEEDEPELERPSSEFNTYSNENRELTNDGFPIFRDDGESESIDFQEEVLSKYKVTENIPGDNKYQPPKVKVVPVPPPCLHPAPPPPPKPKPPSEIWYEQSERPYTLKGSYSNRYRQGSRPRVVGYQPYIVRHFHPPGGTTGVVIRHRMIPMPPPPKRLPPKIVKELHIHHHHGPPTQSKIPAAVHIIKDPSSLDEENKPDLTAERFKPFASSSGHAVISHERFAEPPSFSFS